MKNDIAASLLFALQQSPLGRRTLVQRVGVTESTVRTQLNKLHARGWVDFAKSGTSLTASARKAFSPFLEAIRSVRTLNLDDLDLAPWQCAVQVRGVSLLQSPLILRDRAIQGGASGALLLVYSDKLTFFDSQDALETSYPQSNDALLQVFPTLRREDLLLVAFANDVNQAKRGLWRMVVALLPFSSN